MTNLICVELGPGDQQDHGGEITVIDGCSYCERCAKKIKKENKEEEKELKRKITTMLQGNMPINRKFGRSSY
ncbi:MAG: hypothetical protein V1867_00705 [Candidatus Falkowbacteria bacterium]